MILFRNDCLDSATLDTSRFKFASACTNLGVHSLVPRKTEKDVIVPPTFFLTKVFTNHSAEMMVVLRSLEVVLLDFGLSCLANSDERKQIVGTLLYVAPEVEFDWCTSVEGPLLRLFKVFTRDYDTQVDMWSTGVALYLLLTGLT
eukprot:1246891-Amphidinium_carterae.2